MTQIRHHLRAIKKVFSVYLFYLCYLCAILSPLCYFICGQLLQV